MARMPRFVDVGFVKDSMSAMMLFAFEDNRPWLRRGIPPGPGCGLFMQVAARFRMFSFQMRPALPM